MIYLSSFSFSKKEVTNPNIYPYNVFYEKNDKGLVFNTPITILYGNNGCGKSTVLNIIANKLKLKGFEYASSNQFGITKYFLDFIDECEYSLGEYDDGSPVRNIPDASRYIKSEDILYEIKKIQQEAVLNEGYIYEHVRSGISKENIDSKEMWKDMQNMLFAQEKYSNGETTMQMLEDYMTMDALYLLDEPEVSLSPANQVALAEKINNMARLLGCQFIISTHSPFMLGTLNARIYNLDNKDWEVAKWSDLDNVRYFYSFFKEHEGEFAHLYKLSVDCNQ